MSSSPPWRRVHKGPAQDFTILTIREDQVADPRDGVVHPRVVIECPDWVNVIPVTTDGQVVMVRQWRNGVGEYTLEIPGGMVVPGEPPEAAALRELREETGFTSQALIPLGWVHPNPAVQTNRCFSFLAPDCLRAGTPNPDEGEDIHVELHPKAELPNLVRDRRITHALVVSALYLSGLV